MPASTHDSRKSGLMAVGVMPKSVDIGATASSGDFYFEE